jgi:hypothetical protein
MDAKRMCVVKRIGLCAQALCSICDYTNAIVNIIGWDKTIWSFNKKVNIEFANKQDIHMSSETYEENA